MSWAYRKLVVCDKVVPCKSAFTVILYARLDVGHAVNYSDMQER